MSFTTAQRVFIVCRFSKTKSYITIRNEFTTEFLETENALNKSTILRTINSSTRLVVSTSKCTSEALLS